MNLADLERENQELRTRLAAAERALAAIRDGQDGLHTSEERLRMINAFGDIAERRQQELALRKSVEQLGHRNEQLTLLARVAQILFFSNKTEDELVTAVFDEVAAAIGAEMYFNYQPDDDVSMRLCNWGGLTDDEQTLFETMRYGELLCGRVAATRKPIVVEDIAHTDAEGSETVKAAGYGAYAGFPLQSSDRFLGTIAFITRTKTHFVEGEVQMIQTVCDQVTVTLERVRLKTSGNRLCELRTVAGMESVSHFDSTATKQVEQSLRESERKYRDLFESMAEEVHFWKLDRDASGDTQTWRLVDANPPALKSWGRQSIEEIRGKTTDEIFGSGATEHYLPVVRNIFAKGTPHTFENYFPHLDRHYRFTSVPLGDHFIATGADITAIQKAQEAIVRQSELLSGIVDNIPVLLCIWDPQLKRIQFNKQFREVLGWTEVDAADGDFIAKVYPEPAYRAEVIDYMQSLQTGWRDLDTTSKEGAAVAISWANIALPDGRSIGIGVDIRERKKSENRLLESEERLRLAATAAELGVFEWDLHADIARWENERMYEIVGRTRDVGPLNRTEFIEQALHSEDRSSFEQAIAEAMHPGRVLQTACRLRRCNDGQERWIEFSGQVQFASDGSPQRLIGVARDITERRETDTALRVTRNRLVTAVDASQVVLFHQDRELCYTWIHNPALGYAAQHVVGKRDGEVFQRSEDAACTEAIKRNVIEAGIARREEVCVVQDGEPLYYDLVVQPDRDENGEIVGVNCAAVEITERKKNEDRLRESEERLRLAAEATGLGTYDFNAVTGNTSWSRELYAITGLAETETPEPIKFIYPDDRPAYDQLVARALDRDGPGHHELEFRIQRTNGDVRWVRDTGRTFYDGEGPNRITVRVIGTIQDITERKLAEEELKQTRYTLSEAQKLAHVGSFEFVAATRATVWSEEEYRIYGLSPNAPSPTYDEMLAKYIHPDDAALLHDTFTKAIENREVFELEHRIVRPDGSVRWVYDRAQPHFDESGNLLKYVGATLDVTKRKHAEQTLRESESRFRTMADGIPLIIWVHDATGDLEFVNETFCDYFDVTHERMRAGEWQVLIHPQDAKAYIGEFTSCVREQRFFHAELRARNGQGQWRWLESWGRPRRSDTGEFLGFVGTSADITERKQAEEATRIASESFRQVVERSPLGVYAVDADFRVAQTSAGCEKVFAGIDPLIGRDFAEVLRIVWTEPFASEAIDRFRHTLATGETYHSPNSTQARSNIAIVESYDWQLERMTMPDGRWGVVCYFYETTQRVQAERDARFFGELSERIRLADDAERLTSEVTEALGKHMDLDRCYVVEADVARDTARICGDYHADLPSIAGEFRLSEIPDHFRTDALAGQVTITEDAQADPRSAAYYESAYAPRGMRAHVTVPLRRDDHWVGSLCAVNSSPRVWSSREIGLLETVAERTWNAIEKLRLDASLRESECHLRDVLNSLTAFVGVMNPDGTLIQANDAALKAAGLSPDDVLGKPFDETYWWSYSAEVQAQLREAISLAREGHASRYDVKVRVADGCLIDLDFMLHPKIDKDGRVTHLIPSAIEITGRKQAEQALRIADRRKSEFLATLAHELRNPLATIRSGLEVIKLTRDNPRLVAETREMMERQFTHLVALVDDLLEISRISQGKLRLRHEIVPVTEAIRSAIETCRPLIDEAGHTLTVDLPPQPIYVKGDSHRLSQLFANIIGNATKYTPHGGRIAVTAYQDEEHFIVAVKDSGIGIAADQLALVFEMFAQVDKGESVGYTGLGIGLSLVRSLVEMHGGSITAASDGPGTGSTFTVRLPVTQLKIEANNRDIIEKESATAFTRRVLVVDDNIGAARLLAIIVKALGHEVQTAYNGQEAVERGRAFEPEIVIMDIGMPVMDGYEAARAIRREDWGKGIVLIALTGWGQEDDKQKTRDAGFDCHLVKPVEPDTIRNVLVELAGD